MSEIKPLKEISIDKAPIDSEYNYFLHHERKTALKIPTTVMNAIHKINSSIAHADIFAHAILLRSKSKEDAIIQNWIEVSHNQSNYPITHANTIFSKFLRSTMQSSHLPQVITENELKLVIHFFARCPHGYAIPANLIKSHNEIQVRFT